ncbi:MAG: hypothetical protein WCS87_17940 [Methylococcaceae bacterium]
MDDLRANFNLDDLLTAYHSHTLHRWLEVRDLQDELKQIKCIRGYSEKTIAEQLCKILFSDLNQEEIEAAVYPIEFRKQQQQQLEQLTSQQFSKDAVIKSYHAGYEKLCADMLEKAEDYQFLKAAVNTLWIDYAQLFRVDFNRFFDEFIEKSPLTLFTMLANDDYRQSEIFDGKYHYTNSFEEELQEIEDMDKTYNYKSRIFDKTRYNRSLISSIQSYSGITDGYWKDLQPKGTKCLILGMEAGNFIRNSGKNGEELNAEAINKEFLILDGIDYKSNNADHALIYMVI